MTTALLALLMLAGSPADAGAEVIAAEKAMAAAARKRGQWAAFRAYAAPDAVMFTPTMVSVHTASAGARNPRGSPGRVDISCDGTVAVSTGSWARKGGRTQGTFTTIWVRQGKGWKWVLDQGHETPSTMPSASEPIVRRASCNAVAAARSRSERDDLALGLPSLTAGVDLSSAAPDILYQADDTPPGQPPIGLGIDPGKRLAGGLSRDGTLRWQVDGIDGGTAGAHMLRVWRWDSHRPRLVLIETSGLPAR